MGKRQRHVNERVHVPHIAKSLVVSLSDKQHVMLRSLTKGTGALNSVQRRDSFDCAIVCHEGQAMRRS